MIREYHVRFCEGLGVKSPRSTRRLILAVLAVLVVIIKIAATVNSYAAW